MQPAGLHRQAHLIAGRDRVSGATRATVTRASPTRVSSRISEPSCSTTSTLAAKLRLSSAVAQRQMLGPHAHDHRPALPRLERAARWAR